MRSFFLNESLAAIVMARSKRRSMGFLFLVATVLLALLVGSLLLMGSIMYKSSCICKGEWAGGICQTDDWAYELSLQAPNLNCPLRGIQSEKWICIGFWESTTIYTGIGTSNGAVCHGVEIDLGQCYGIPYSASSDDKDGPISCNYPCDDQQLLEACQTQDAIEFERVTVSCTELGKWCH